MAAKMYYNVALSDDVFDDMPTYMKGLTKEELDRVISKWIDRASAESMLSIFPHDMEITDDEYDDLNDMLIDQEDGVPGEVCPNCYKETFCLGCQYCDSCEKGCKQDDI